MERIESGLPEQKAKRNSLIDFYRVVFSLIVVSHHSRYLDGRYEGDITHFVPFDGGYSAVEFFFILSGYLLTKSIYEKEKCSDLNRSCTGTWRQVKKKVCAIYPLFAFTYAISFFVRQMVVQEGFSVIANNFWRSIGELMLIRAIGFAFQPFEYVGPMWYVTTLLVAIVVLYPFMARFREVFSAWIAPLLVLFIYGYSLMSTGMIGSTYSWMGCLRAIAGIALGNIVCRLVNLHTIRLTTVGKYVTAILEIGIMLLVLYFMNAYHDEYHDFIESILFCVLIYLAFAADTSLNHIFERFSRPFEAFSVGLYVTHMALIWIPWSELNLPWRYVYLLWMLSTSIFAICALAVCGWIKPKAKKCVLKLKRLLLVEC